MRAERVISFLLLCGIVPIQSAAAAPFFYDPLHRLKKATYPDGTVIEFTYDTNGNQLSRKVTSPYRLISVEIPEGGGAVTGAGIGKVGTTKVLTAVPELGKDLDTWRDGASVLSRSPTLSLIVSDSLSLKAYFAPALTAYATRHGLDPATTGAPDANPSGDGIPNIIKFALGADPKVPDHSILPKFQAGTRNGAPVFIYTADYSAKAADTVSVTVEYSYDLAAWTTAVDGQGGVVLARETVTPDTVRLVATIPVQNGKAFARLRVVKIR